MDVMNRIRLAQYHNRRGVRMLKCKGGVETCTHRRAFHQLAQECFEARDWHMSQVRIVAGARKSFLYVIESLDVEGRYLGECKARDELGAASTFEADCEWLGVPVGAYRVVRIKRVRL
jgi:hypothetical protein